MGNEAKIVLSAEDKTRAAFAAARSNLTGLQGSAESLNASFGSFGKVFGAAFAGLSFTAFIKSTASGLDKLNDLKDATGASVENISALEDVAARTGGTIDDVSTSLVKFNSVLNAADPGSQNANVFKQLGLDAQALKKEDPAEALRKVAVELSGFADDGNKARIIAALFGKSIKEVAPFLNDLATQTKLVGTVTAQQADEAERFTHQLDALSKNSLDLARNLTSALLPSLNNVFEAFKKYGGLKGTILAIFGQDELSQAGARAEQLVADSKRVGDSIERMSEELSRNPGNDQLALRIEKARAKLAELTAAASAASNQLKELSGSNADAQRRQEDRGFTPGKRALGNVADADKAAKAAKKQKELLAGLSADRQEAFSVSEAALRQATDQALREAEIGDLAAKNSEIFEFQIRQYQRLNDLLEATPTAKLEETRQDMLFLAEAFERGAITAEQFNEAANARLGNTEEIKAQIDDLKVFADQAGRNIQDALGNTVEATLRGNFDSIGKLWGDLLIRMASEAVAAKIGQELLGDFTKTGNIGGSIGSLIALFGSANGNAFAGGSVSAFAKGGILGPNGGLLDRPTFFPMAKGGIGIGGEAGTEAVLPLKRGANGKLGVQAEGGRGGGAVVNYAPTIYIDSRTDQAVVAQLVGAAVQQGQRQMLEHLSATGAI